MMLNTIIVSYWHLTKYHNIDIEHNTEYVYSDDILNELIKYIMSGGANIMLYQSKDTLILYIDKKRFGQS